MQDYNANHVMMAYGIYKILAFNMLKQEMERLESAWLVRVQSNAKGWVEGKNEYHDTVQFSRRSTSKKRDIDNYQGLGMSQLEINQQKDYESQKYWPMKFRASPSPIYNCHGLTFACRRTCIDKSSEIMKILEDDNYQPILSLMDVLPGDIILYINNDDNDICHSGIIVEVNFDNQLPKIMVLSKWGKYKEAIHLYNTLAYPNTSKSFFRMML